MNSLKRNAEGVFSPFSLPFVVCALLAFLKSGLFEVVNVSLASSSSPIFIEFGVQGEEVAGLALFPLFDFYLELPIIHFG